MTRIEEKAMAFITAMDNLRWCNVWNGINGMGDDGFCNYWEERND